MYLGGGGDGRRGRMGERGGRGHSAAPPYEQLLADLSAGNMLGHEFLQKTMTPLLRKVTFSVCISVFHIQIVSSPDHTFQAKV